MRTVALYVFNSVRTDRTCIVHTLFVHLFRLTNHGPCSHDGTVASCVTYTCWFTPALAHKLFVPLSTLLSNLCPIAILTLYDLRHRSSRARKDLVVYFY
jgi:hypothetical protein